MPATDSRVEEAARVFVALNDAGRCSVAELAEGLGLSEREIRAALAVLRRRRRSPPVVTVAYEQQDGKRVPFYQVADRRVLPFSVVDEEAVARYLGDE